MNKRIAVCLVCIFSLFNLCCQTVDDKAVDLTQSDEPVEYERKEFPEWMHTLRRAEIIFAGSVPFSLLFANLGYGIYNSLAEGIGSGASIENFTSSSSLEADERKNILYISLSISGAITAADFIIGLFSNDKSNE